MLADFFILGLLPLKITSPFICKAFRSCQQPIQEPTALAPFQTIFLKVSPELLVIG